MRLFLIFIATLLVKKVNLLHLLEQNNNSAVYLAYMATFGKSYPDPQEFQMRYQLWLSTNDLIESLSSSTFTMNHNRFSDWTQEEKNKLKGALPPQPNYVSNHT